MSIKSTLKDYLEHRKTRITQEKTRQLTEAAA